MTVDPRLYSLAERVLEMMRERGLTLATAESCTGGLVASTITRVPGSSDVFLGGVVSYANRVKEQVLGVSPKTLAAVGAVSPECAKEMAEGVRRLMGADVAISTTGIAGPSGGTPEKPVGLVYCHITDGSRQRPLRLTLSGDRHQIQDETVSRLLSELVRFLDETNS